MKHLIQLWKCDWVKQIVKMNEAVGMKNNITMDGGGKRLVRHFKGKSSGNVLVLLYRQLPMGIKYTSFGVKYQKFLVGWHLLNYKEMLVETPIYFRCVVITIVIFTSMLAIELFYLTQLFSFLGCFFDYLSLFLPYKFAIYP